MKKILVISTVGLLYDGITSVILSYLTSMNREGLNIYIASTIKCEEVIRKKFENLECTIVDFPNRKKNPIKYFVALYRFIKKEKIDIVHAHGNSATLTVEMISAWAAGCNRRIAHSHNTKCEQVCIDSILRPFFKYFYTDAIACGTEAGEWLFGKESFSVLENGRNIDDFTFNQERRHNIRQQYGIKDEIVIGHVGGFVEQKNHRFVLEIYKEIKKLEPCAKFFMIGDGSLKDDIKTEAEEVGLDIFFTGVVENVSDYLCAIDGMVLPSLFEGVPLVAIEWQINGLPCLISNNVSPECIMTTLIRRMSLQEPAKKWAMTIIDMIKKNDRNISLQEGSYAITNSRYNIQIGAQRLRKLYFSRNYCDFCIWEDALK